ncbi:hypothetical protein HanIR_Chr07g0335091 [Helianthus annuus]|nr:hypothetical protein HanIR_Chr07g0335091 [Helianthus annuus]
MNECSRTPYRTFTNTIERTRPLFMFVHLTNRTEFLVHVRSFIKRTNINELPAEQFTNCSLNVRFVYSPTLDDTGTTRFMVQVLNDRRSIVYVCLMFQ